MPTLSVLENYRNDDTHNLKYKWASFKKTSAGEIMQKGLIAIPNNQSEGVVLSGPGESSSNSYKQVQRRRTGKSVFVTQQGNIVGSGTNEILNALSAYLRYLEGTMRDDWQE